MKKRIKKSSLLISFLVVSCSFLTGTALGKTELEKKKERIEREQRKRGVTYTVETLLDQYISDLERMNDKKVPIRSLLASYTQSDNLTENFESIFVSKFLNRSSKTKIKALTCIECTAVRAHLEEDEFVLERGLQKEEELKELLSENSTHYYTNVYLNKIENEIILIISVNNHKTKEIVFSKEYRSPFYYIKSNGVIFSLQGGVLIAQSKSFFGGELSFGQRIERVGNFGINAGAYLNINTLEPIIAGGIYFTPNFNDIFNGHWTWASILMPIKLGGTVSTASQLLHGGIGLKLKLGSIFYIHSEARFYYQLQKSTDVNKSSADPLNFNGNVPLSIIIGIGADVG